MADKILWDLFEEKYAGLFPSDTGNVTKPLRIALASLVILSRFRFPNKELVEPITKKLYLQYFIGLSGWQGTLPFDAGILVLLRKRITVDMLCEINGYLLAHLPFKLPSFGNGTDENSIPKAAV